QLKNANQTISNLENRLSTVEASTVATPQGQSPVAATASASAPGPIASYNENEAPLIAPTVLQIPTSISQLSPEELARGGVEDLARLQYLVPSLRYGQTGHEVQQAMRGARTNVTGAESSPVVAVYEDGIYASTTTEQLNSLLDVERIDVLRGPQVTSFGQQAYAGAVSVVSRRPTFDSFNGYAEAENGLPDKTRWRMAMNLPASDTLAFRVAGLSESRSGWINNSFIESDSDDLNDRKVQVLRASVLWQPTDKFSILFWSRYLDENGTGSAPWGYQQVGAYVDGEYQPGNQFASPGAIQDTGPWDVTRNMISATEYENWLNTVDLNWDIGFATFQWLFNFTSFHGRQSYDNDYTNLGGVNTAAVAGWKNSQTGLSNEFRLTSNDQGSLHWLAGFYYSDRTADWHYLEDNYGDLVRPSWDTGGDYTTSTTAVFGQLSYDITERFRATAGLRWNDESKTTRTGVKGSWDDVLWKAALEYDINEDMMTFVSVSTGYRAGGNNTAPGVNPAWAPEKLTAYEIGLKSVLVDGKVSMNLSAWYNDFSDVQSQSFLVMPYPGSPEATEYTGNGGPLSAKGIDAEIQWTPNSNWDIATNIAYTNATFGNYTAANLPGLGDIPGHTQGDLLSFNGWQPALTPDWVMGLRAAYTYEFRERGSLTPYVQTTYASDYYVNDINLPGVQQGSHYITDIRLIWQSPNDSFDLQFYYLNAKDEAVLNGSRVYNPAARPDITTLQANWTNPNTYGIIFNYTF
ncbi:MAG: TonB-dependent receptor, partial [Xanthomonadales bacterium]|nr:TonB-dependent receptor [Xanthomonadales bacterium]